MRLRFLKTTPVALRTLALLALLALALPALAGCGSGQQPAASTATATPVTTSTVFTVDESAAGQLIELQRGQILQVTLKSNPTTGYHWVVSYIDTSLLKQQGDPVYTPDPGTEGLVGAGGKDTFTFNTSSPGQTDLKLDYLTPDGRPSGTSFQITVKVE